MTSTQRDEQIAALAPMVRQAAQTTARNWPRVIDADDAEQEIWLRLLESNGYLTTLSEMLMSRQKNALRGMGNQIAAEYGSAYESFSGNIHYSTGEVRQLLETGALTDTPETFRADYADLTEAFLELNDQYADVLIRRFALDEHPEYRMTVTRAVDALTDRMNRIARARRHNGGPGSRRAMSNSKTQHMTGTHD